MTEVSRASHLEAVADLLWPAPQCWSIGHRRVEHEAPAQSFLIIPSAKNPRYLVPAGPSVASAAVRNLPQGTRFRDRARGTLLTELLRSRVGRRTLRDRLYVHGESSPTDGEAGLKALLDGITGADTYWAMPISRARANRKPVLQLLGGNGHPVAFVKVGTNELTRTLVCAEAAALRDLSRRFSELRVPDVIAFTSWQSLDLLVLSPLPLAGAGSEPSQFQVGNAARELSEVAGVSRELLTESSYWRGLGTRLGSATDPRSLELARVWRALTDQYAHAVLTIGSWHGDWAPWNMASNGKQLFVWDFERFERGVPIGFDLVHFDLQTRILDPKVRPEEVINTRRRNAPELLRPLGLGADDSRLVFTTYLLEIASRWIADRQDVAGGSGDALNAVVRAAALEIDPSKDGH